MLVPLRSKALKPEIWFDVLAQLGAGKRGKKRATSCGTQSTPSRAHVGVQVGPIPTMHRSVQADMIFGDEAVQAVKSQSVGGKLKLDDIVSCHLCYQVHEKDCYKL